MNAATYAARRAAGLCTACPGRAPLRALQWGLCADHFAAQLIRNLRSGWQAFRSIGDEWHGDPDDLCDDPPEPLASGVARGYVPVDLELMAD